MVKTVNRKYPIKEYEIWIGYYHMGQGSVPSTEPKLVATVNAPNFKVACALYEKVLSLNTIKESINLNRYVSSQDCVSHLNFEKSYNSWTGQYYETEEEALKSFK